MTPRDLILQGLEHLPNYLLDQVLVFLRFQMYWELVFLRWQLYWVYVLLELVFLCLLDYQLQGLS